MTLRTVYVDQDLRYFGYQNKVYSNDDGRLLTNLSFHGQWFLPEKGLITGVAQSEILVASVNDGRIVASVSVPKSSGRLLGRDGEDGNVFGQIFIDLKRNLLVIGQRQHVVLIPIETLGLPNEPILFLKQPPPKTVALGELCEFKLQTVSGVGDYKLIEGPEGMTVEANTLRWRPETAYTGPVDVKLSVAAGEAKRELSWRMTVE